MHRFIKSPREKKMVFEKSKKYQERGREKKGKRFLCLEISRARPDVGATNLNEIVGIVVQTSV